MSRNSVFSGVAKTVAGFRGSTRVLQQCGIAAGTRQAASSMSISVCSLSAVRGYGAPRMLVSAKGSRAFSSNLELVLRQVDSALATVKNAQDIIMAAKWNELDPEELEEMVEGVGRGRDLINSLSPEEAKSAEAAKGLVSTVEAAEARLTAAIKSDELAYEAKNLRMEMEDLGTTGDGDNKPEAFKSEWETRFTQLMTNYSELLENCHASFVGKVERDCGYQLLLLKRVVHVDHFRYTFPKVHPSGFSASAD